MRLEIKALAERSATLEASLGKEAVMRIRTFVGIGAAVWAFAALAATPAAASCCDTMKEACCLMQTTTCCAHVNHPAAVAALIPQVEPEPRPVRETMTVSFMKPVKLGDRILLGKYIIEHDNDRMARGRPCTHVYAASDPRLPVVAFHCTHLKGAAIGRASVTLRPLGEPNGMRELTQFQFAGDRDAHGAPGVR